MVWEPGDRVIVTDHGYRACLNTMLRLVETRGIEIVTVTIPLPVRSLREVVDRSGRARPGRAQPSRHGLRSSRHAQVDLRAERLIDPVDAPRLPRPPAPRDHVGRRDARSWSRQSDSCPVRLERHARPDRIPRDARSDRRLGGAWRRLAGYSRAKSRSGAGSTWFAARAARWRSRADRPDDMHGSMAAIPIALPSGAAPLAVQAQLLDEGIELPVMALPGHGTFIRISAHVYNRLAD